MNEVAYHKKYINRLAKIFAKKSREEGKQAAQEWADRTLTPELIPEVVKVLQQGVK